MLRRWRVEVVRGADLRLYTVLAVNELDARIIACGLDGSFQDLIELKMSDIELVKIYSSILEVSDV